MDAMTNPRSWVEGFRFYELLMVMVDKKKFGSWAYIIGCYEELRVLDDMNNLGFHKLHPLDAMNSSGLRMIWTILGHEPMSLNDMNSLSYG